MSDRRDDEPSVVLEPDEPTIEQMVDQTLGRVLDLFDVGTDVVNRWEGLAPARTRDIS